MSKKVMQRSEVEKNMTWDLSHLYAQEKDVINDLDKMDELSLQMEKKYKGNLKDADLILEALKDYEEILKLNNLISSYRFLEVSVDMTNEENQSKLQETSNVVAKAMTRISFIESEILENSYCFCLLFNISDKQLHHPVGFRKRLPFLIS